MAALRHDGGPCRVGVCEDRRNLLGLAGLEHERGLPMITVPPFDEIGRHRLRVADGIVLAHDAHERVESCLSRRLMGLLARHSDVALVLIAGAPQAARCRRSLMASPSPRFGIGITAMVLAPEWSSSRSAPNSRAAASARSPLALRLIVPIAPLGVRGPNARRASSEPTVVAPSLSFVSGA